MKAGKTGGVEKNKKKSKKVLTYMARGDKIYLVDAQERRHKHLDN